MRFYKLVLFFNIVLIVLLITLNEFTLYYLDETPPLSEQSLKYIRTFNFIIIVILCTELGIKYFQNLKKFISLLTFYIFIIIILDTTFSWIGYGYHGHYKEENLQRYPSPYDMFSGKPNALDHNEFGFRGNFENINKLDDDTFTVAFFGGSTGYLGEPPIIEIVKQQLKKSKTKVSVYNFSSVSSNHTQHLHRLIKHINKFKFDIVIFYGGANETLLNTMYDPRPGYPYNFFYRNELSTIKKFFVEHSAILGEIDKRYDSIIELNKIRKKYRNEENWQIKITQKYYDDLILASEISKRIGSPKKCSKTNFISIRQPFLVSSKLDKDLYLQLDKISKALIKDLNHNHFDLSKINKKNLLTYIDPIHIDQNSKIIIAKQMKEYLLLILKNC